MPRYVPSENLTRALAAHRATVQAEKDALELLHKAIAEEVDLPAKPADVARFVDYHPSHVTRIARAHGVGPRIARQPPRRPGVGSGPVTDES